MKVSEIMTRDPVCCIPESDLRSVARMMLDCDCGEIPVVDGAESRKPIGAVTDRDIVCRTIAEGKNPLELTARDCMSTPCVTVTPETTVDACCKILEERQLRRVPVVDGQGCCCGMVSQADIARSLSQKRTAQVLREVSKPRGEARQYGM